MKALILPGDEDGFLSFHSYSDSLTYLNVTPLPDEVSPFCRNDATFEFDGAGIVVDSYYGQVYTAKKDLPLGLYGCTNDLPMYSGDEAADLGWLRVPFRRIPRLLVRNRDELDAIVGTSWSADPNLKVFYRGQVREYFLSRKSSVREVLFGDEHALEPSLLPSCVRAGLSLEAIGPEWSTVVQLYMASAFYKLAAKGWASEQTLRRIQEEMTRQASGYNLWFFLLALAQHYGLPSAGLDVTSNLEVALYFALTEFTPHPDDRSLMVTQRRSSEGCPSVLYMLANYQEHWFDFAQVRPMGFPLARPDAQDAFFLHTGWGYGSNKIARYMFLALYLDPKGDWGHIPETREVFPDHKSDEFGRFLSEARSLVSPRLFASFLSRFHWAI